MRWGDAHLAGPEGLPIVLRHNTCGEIADPRLTCQHCGQPIEVSDVTPNPAPDSATANARKNSAKPSPKFK
jgi:hypothetical protein